MIADVLLHLGSSLLRIAAVLTIAFTAAWPLGLMLGRRRSLAFLFNPLTEFLYSIPKVALFPLFIIFLGLNDRARIATAALAVFFQVLISVRDAAEAIPDEYIVSLDCLGGRLKERIRWVYIPALLPASFSSLRVGSSAAFAVLFFTEASVTSGYGLGRLVAEKWSELDYGALSGAAVITALAGYLVFILIDFLEKKLVRYSSSGS